MIDSQEGVAALIPQVATARWVALDTEADSLFAYPEKLCLLQLTTVDGDELIDPLADLELSPLLKELAGRELILHGADYDLRLLYRSYGFVPHKIFDTMWAARLCGMTEFGLVNLAEQLLDVKLEKGPQKMNWAQRPLTDRMMSYARNDTRYLKTLADLLTEKLKAKGRLAWMEETCAWMVEECRRAKIQDPDQVWRLKGSDKLPPKGLAVMRELWHWREQEALAANRPPYFVLSHEALLKVAATAARDEDARVAVPRTLPSGRRRRLHQALSAALEVPEEVYPEKRRSIGYRLTKHEQDQFERLRAVRDVRAAELGLDPSLIASRADLVALARDWESGKARMMRWQMLLLG